MENVENVQDAVNKLANLFDAERKADEQRDAEIKKFGEESAETKQTIAKIEDQISEVESLKSRLEAVENVQNRPIDEDVKGLSKEEADYLKSFESFIRNPMDTEVKNAIAMQQKAVTIGAATSGGYAVPEVISRRIEEKLVDISPVRSVATVETVSTSDYKKLVNTKGTSFEWLGESATRNETNTPILQEVAPTFGTASAKPQASEEALQDIFFNVESWLVDNVSEELARGEGAAFISGDGTNKPTGFLNGTPVTAGDEDSPARAFGTLQYTPSGAASGFASSNPSDAIIELVHTLKAGYRSNAKFMMGKATAAEVRKFKTGDGHYLWQPSLAAGNPSQLMGYDVVEAEDMPGVAANAFPIAFGDFRAGYLIVDRAGMRMSIDDNITAPGFVKFYVRKRVGGILMNDDAIKVLKIATS